MLSNCCSTLFLAVICNCCLCCDQAVQNYDKRRPCALPYSPSGDAVLITKADLEGYHSTCDADMELAIVPKLPRTMPMIARLSCLFASLKVSGSSVPMIRRLPVSESRAC